MVKFLEMIEHKLPVYDEADRVKWDLFISSLILIAAFEIPYDWLVGWKDQLWAHIFNFVFFIAFAIDMFVNALSQRREQKWFVHEWMTSFSQPSVSDKNETILVRPRDTTIGYLKTIWFPIDLLSTIPWAFFAELFSPLNSLRLLRLLRLARLFKVLRLTKALYLLERVRRAIPSAPSVERLFFLFLSIPWITHLFACIFYAIEHEHHNVTYGSSFYLMWMALMTQEVKGTGISDASFWLLMSAVLLSVFVFASVTGNFAAIYTGLDFSDKRRSTVLLKDHTVVIGWNNNIYSMISELQVNVEGLNEDVVLLSPYSESVVIKRFEENGVIFDPRHLTIVEGSIYSVKNIEQMAIDRARNVIIIGGDSTDAQLHGRDEEFIFQQADIQVLKILLACIQIFQGQEKKGRAFQEQRQVPIVASVHSEQNAQLLRSGIPQQLKSQKTQFSLQVVDTEDVLSRCLAQATKQPQLIQIFSELFSYRHNSSNAVGYDSVEVYIIPVNEYSNYTDKILGKCFDEINSCFPAAELIGYFTSDEHVILEAIQRYDAKRPNGGEQHLVLNPGHRSINVKDRGPENIVLPQETEHLFDSDDQLVLIARGRNDALKWEEYSGDKSSELFQDIQIEDIVKIEEAPRKVLLLGTSRKATKLGALLPDFLPKGSSIYCQSSDINMKDERAFVYPIPELQHQKEFFDISNILKELSGKEDFDTRLVLSDSLDRTQHDANILMTLTALHAATDEKVNHSHTIFEIIDQQNERLAHSFNVGNRKVASLLSTELVSNYLIQLANNPKRGLVYKELMDRSGNEIYLDDYYVYVDLFQKVVNDTTVFPSYPDIEQMARKIGRVVIGVYGVEYIHNMTFNESYSKEYTTMCPLPVHLSSDRGVSFDFHAPLLPDDVYDAEVYRSKSSLRTVKSIVVVGPGPL